MARGLTTTAASLCAALLAVASAATTVKIGGFTQPVTVTWDGAGRVYVGEKGGAIKIAPSFDATSATPLIDLTSSVVTYGDFGLTSLHYDQINNFLYAAYMVKGPNNTATCTDNGSPGSRTPSQIIGCGAVYGSVSRWPIMNGAVTGPEQVLVNRTSPKNTCAQFMGNPIDTVYADGAGKVYFSAGAGSNDFTTDTGNLGTNPCDTGAALGGAFRAQDPLTLDGKLSVLDLATGTTTILAKGFKNPFRFVINGTQVYALDLGLNGPDEVNSFTVGGATVPNCGFPCYEANATLPAYQTAAPSECTAVNTDPALVMPILNHQGATPSARHSLSAIVHDPSVNRVFIGDYTLNTISSITTTGTDEQVVTHGVFPVDLKIAPAPYGMIYVDIVTGQVKSVPAPATSGAASRFSSAAVLAASVAGLAALATVRM